MPRSTAASKNALIQQAIQDTLPTEADVVIHEGRVVDDLFAPIEETSDTYNFCFYGAEGSGKTTQLASAANVAPEGSKILLVNAEGGIKKKALERRGIDISKIVIYPNPDTGEKIVNQVSEGRLAKSKLRIENAGGSAQFDEHDEFFTDRDDYGVMSKMVKDLLRKYRDLPCHFVATALERRDVDEKTTKVSYGPAVTPGLQNAILGYTDVNLYFKKGDEDGPFRALVSGVASYRTKDRMGGLPKVLAEPSFERILGYTNGDLDETTDPLQMTLPAIRQPKVAPSGKIRGKKPEAAAEATPGTTEEPDVE